MYSEETGGVYVRHTENEARCSIWSKQGVNKKIPHSDWATPIVVVTKTAGQSMFMWRFQNPINPVLKTDIYPLPLPEKLFRS